MTASARDLSPEAVERLARNMELIAERSGFNAADWERGAAILRALVAEIERLRGVLKTLAEPRDRTFIGDPWAFYDDMTAYARAALAEGDKP